MQIMFWRFYESRRNALFYTGKQKYPEDVEI